MDTRVNDLRQRTAGQEMTGVPQQSDSAKTIPNGSSHSIGTTIAAASQAVGSWRHHPLAYVLNLVASEVRFDFGPPVVAGLALRGMVSGNEESSSCLPGDCNRCVCALDALNTAEEH